MHKLKERRNGQGVEREIFKSGTMSKTKRPEILWSLEAWKELRERWCIRANNAEKSLLWDA